MDIGVGKALLIASAPSFGPAVVTIFGENVPILAMVLSVTGLVLARIVSPPPSRKLSPRQDIALTILLLVILFLIVSGQFSDEPLGVGMATVWGIGLGFSGLLVIEFFGARIMNALKGFFQYGGPHV